MLPRTPAPPVASRPRRAPNAPLRPPPPVYAGVPPSAAMSGRATAALVVVLAAAFATNPDDESFKRYIETELHKYCARPTACRAWHRALTCSGCRGMGGAPRRSGASWLERKLVSTVGALAYPRKVGPACRRRPGRGAGCADAPPPNMLQVGASRTTSSFRWSGWRTWTACTWASLACGSR